MTYNGCDQNHRSPGLLLPWAKEKNDAFWPKMASPCCATDHQGSAMRSFTWGVFGPSTEAVYLIDMILWRVCLYLMSPRQVITCKTTTNQVTSRQTEPKDSWESKPAVATRPCPLGKHRCLTGLGPPNISRVRHARSKLSLSRACGIRTMSPLSLRMILSMRWSTWTPPVWIFGTCVRSTCPEPRAAITQMILCFFTLEFSVATSSRASDRRLKLGCLSEKRHLPMCSFEPHGRPVCSASARPSPETNNVAWPKSFSHSLSLLFGPWVRPPSLTSGPVGMHDLICAIAQRSTYFKGNNRASVYHLDCSRALHRYVSSV